MEAIMGETEDDDRVIRIIEWLLWTPELYSEALLRVNAITRLFLAFGKVRNPLFLSF